MDLFELPLWEQPAKMAAIRPQDGPLKKAFEAAFSVSEVFSNVRDRMTAALDVPRRQPPEREARESLLVFASGVDSDFARFMFQDEPGETVAIIVDVLDRARSPPDATYSACRSGDKAGPVVPVRYHVGRRATADAAARIIQSSGRQRLPRNPRGRMDECMTVKAWTPEEVCIIERWLLDSTSRLSPACLAAFAASELSCKGAFQLGFIAVPAPPPIFTEAPTDYPCSGPGCTKRTTQRCAGCSGACYCSRECQRAHWKTHKKVCAKGSTEAAAATAAPSPVPSSSSSAPSPSGGGAQQQGRSSVIVSMTASETPPGFVSFSLPHTGAPSGQRVVGGEGPAVNVHGEAAFLIKVQRAIGAPHMPMMVYDQQRSFMLQVRRG
jgi:hypothetical protein